MARLALVSCDAFDNFPPGLTGKTLVTTGKLPPALLGVKLTGKLKEGVTATDLC